MGLPSGMVDKAVLFKMVYGLGGVGGAGKDTCIGWTSSTLGKAEGIELVLDIIVGSTF